MNDRSNEPSHHKRMLLPQSYILLLIQTLFGCVFQIYIQHVTQESPVLREELVECFKEINDGLDQLYKLSQHLQLAIPSAKKFTSLPAPGESNITGYTC